MKKAPLLLLAAALLLAGCVSGGPDTASSSRTAASGDSFKNPPQAKTYIGRRFYNEKYMYWGFLKPEGHSWGDSARLVVLREEVPAPDRANGPRGRDDNHEYRLTGYFSGQKAYEPKSDYILDVFVVQSFELLSTNNAAFDMKGIPLWNSKGRIQKPSISKTSTKLGNRLQNEEF